MQLVSPEPPNEDTFSSWVKYLDDLKKNNDNENRKAASYRLYKLYKGKQRDETESALIKRIGNQVRIGKHPVWCQNVLRFGVNLLASTYDGVVERSVGDVDEKTESNIQETIWLDQNCAMTEASAMLIYDQMALVQIVPKETELSYLVYNQFKYDLVRNDDDVLTAVILSDYGQDEEKTTYRIYTTENTWHIRNKRLISEEPNELGVLPFILITSENLGSQDYLDPIEEYADGQIELNCLLSGNLYTHQLQSHAVMWTRLVPDSAIGETSEDGTQLDSTNQNLTLPAPSSAQAIVLYQDEQGNKEEIGYLTPGVNFADILGVGKEYIMNYLENMGIPRDAVGMELSGAIMKPATTGYLAERRLRDLNSPYKTIFSKAEKEIFGIAFTIATNLRLLNEGQVDPKQFNVNFASQPRRLDSIEIAELLQLNNDEIIDRAEVLRSIKGISRSEAIEEIAKFDAFREEEKKDESTDNEPVNEIGQFDEFGQPDTQFAGQQEDNTI